MRFTSAVFAAVAIGASAMPQEYSAVQPITQISDGQIQAPPATAAPVPSSGYAVPVPSGTEGLPSEVPGVTPVPLPSVVPSEAPVPEVPSETAVPSVPVGTGSVPPYPIPSSAPAYGNSTVPAPTGSGSSTATAPESTESETGSPQPSEAPGSASTSVVSFAAVFAGLLAYLA